MKTVERKTTLTAEEARQECAEWAAAAQQHGREYGGPTNPALEMAYKWAIVTQALADTRWMEPLPAEDAA